MGTTRHSIIAYYESSGGYSLHVERQRDPELRPRGVRFADEAWLTVRLAAPARPPVVLRVRASPKMASRPFLPLPVLAMLSRRGVPRSRSDDIRAILAAVPDRLIFAVSALAGLTKKIFCPPCWTC